MRSGPRSALRWPQGLIVAFLLAMLVTLGIVGSLFSPIGAWPRIEQGIYGEVVLREGNCMPLVGGNPYCQVSLVSRTVYVRELVVGADMMDHTYLRVKTPLIATTEARQGFFEVPLPVGLYSVFVEDEGGEYCRGFSYSDPGRIPVFCSVRVYSGSTTPYDITIDHASS
ncbi:MAG: hypothetical protein ACE5LS_00635 [Thermoplasmata archaeon]